MLWSQLPNELVHRIFVLAAGSSISCCVSLCRVASWTRHLALPYLLTTVIIRDKTPQLSFFNCLHSTPRDPPYPGFRPASLVRDLWITSTAQSIIILVNACENVTNVALKQGGLGWLTQASSPRVPSYFRFSKENSARTIDWNVLIFGKYRPPSFASNDSFILTRVTHLRLADLDLHEGYIFEFTRFSRLSHLALPYHHPSAQKLLPLLNHVLEQQTLQVLVIVVLTDRSDDEDKERAYQWVKKARSTDPRVYVVERVSDHLQEEWEYEVRGGESVWGAAVKFTMKLGSPASY
jgi:hypothetical protein